MKLKNTLENKARFFALYWNLNIGKCKSYHRNVITRISADTIEIIDYLELTPLSLITDEDAIEVAKIFKYGGEVNALAATKDWCIAIQNNTRNYFSSFHQDYINAFDFLRSKGYALPYMNLSLDDLIQYGWVLLKEVKDERINIRIGNV